MLLTEVQVDGQFGTIWPFQFSRLGLRRKTGLLKITKFASSPVTEGGLG